jgi:YrbI family 3-deoxy-D-manno-octulosonate 8-phosphate phosphatase
MFNACLEECLRSIRLLAMDVDGVLTDGSITWGMAASGEFIELKSFHVKDGLGLGLARAAGLEIAWITGRTSPIVERRAAELGVGEVHQWARNKRVALAEIARRLDRTQEQVLYVGDDLNDLPAFEAAGVKVAVADAALLLRERADWVTAAAGGQGAVREVVEGVLRAQNRWDEAVSAFLARLDQEQAEGSGQ